VLAGQIALKQVPEHDFRPASPGAHRGCSKRGAFVWPRRKYRHDDRKLLALARIFSREDRWLCR
jgi:hypothetical protein